MDAKTSSNTMSVPPEPARVQQSSIRSFFQPRAPNYTPPPVIHNGPASPTPVPDPSIQPSVSSPPPNNENGSVSTVPKQSTISQIEPSHIQPLRRINALLLPVNYPDSFYRNILDPSTTPSFSRVILWQDGPSNPPKVVGGIVCRLDPSLAPDSTPAAPKYVEGCFDIYVQSLVLLSPYRGHGLAAAALKSVIDTATEQIRVRIAGLFAHVWTENTDALEWYVARGFTKEEPVIPGYYRRLKPDSAWILRKRLSIGDHLSRPSPGAAPKGAPAPSTADAPPAQTSRPPGFSRATSFQDRRPDREWNDLPEDVLGGSLLKPPSEFASKEGSTASSRSSSRSAPRKKKERLYPAAAFGS
ncbi:hypothetical protein D0Z07_8827 [Hyphodiscus hymeniophilus]|uniref:N-acetyltransferase domain-containing protein n=1 Tax=Hyphodiscus hymeniophilus TaxID=353542 RepID=A0A9P6SJV0_9HELO|nr:hypothetical protein D0Z07_8827 [Hyphodiscus hymeniophilus]